jgi:hypothetical protein
LIQELIYEKSNLNLILIFHHLIYEWLLFYLHYTQFLLL